MAEEFDPKRPCGTHKRGKGAYTKDELHRIAKSYGVDVGKKTMDVLCKELSELVAAGAKPGKKETAKKEAEKEVKKEEKKGVQKVKEVAKKAEKAVKDASTKEDAKREEKKGEREVKREVEKAEKKMKETAKKGSVSPKVEKAQEKKLEKAADAAVDEVKKVEKAEEARNLHCPPGKESQRKSQQREPRHPQDWKRKLKLVVRKLFLQRWQDHLQASRKVLRKRQERRESDNVSCRERELSVHALEVRRHKGDRKYRYLQSILVSIDTRTTRIG
jgi:hypothetical protein